MSRPRLFLALALLLAAFRPFIDRIDHWLTGGCWLMPNLWDTVADEAIRRGVVDPVIDGRRATFRDAAILRPVPRAVVTVSNMRRSRMTFLDRDYRILGQFERLSADPALVTDEERGYKPLSHLWPVYDANRDGRLETLVAFAPNWSDALMGGTYAYLSLGSDRSELLLALEIPSGRSLVLERAPLNAQGFEDLAVYPVRGDLLVDRRRPAVLFRWQPELGAYVPEVDPSAQNTIVFWASSPKGRVLVGPRDCLDDRVREVLESVKRIAPDAASPGGAHAG